MGRTRLTVLSRMRMEAFPSQKLLRPMMIRRGSRSVPVDGEELFERCQGSAAALAFLTSHVALADREATFDVDAAVRVLRAAVADFGGVDGAGRAHSATRTPRPGCRTPGGTAAVLRRRLAVEQVHPVPRSPAGPLSLRHAGREAQRRSCTTYRVRQRAVGRTYNPVS